MMLDIDLTFETDAKWVSPLVIMPLVIMPKKGGKLRICIDFRDLNFNTIKTKYWAPFIYEDIINYLEEQEADWFAVLDLLSRYWQILMAKNLKLYTAFTCFLGAFACRRMYFGLTNAVASFQKMMNTILRGLIGKAYFIYIDDIVVFGKTKE